MAKSYQAVANTMSRRYADAYRVARVVIRFGGIVKTTGVVLIVLLLVGGLFVAAQSPMGQNPAVVFIVCALLAVVIGGVPYILGVVTAAQGQVMFAVLDTAVNTSPILETSEKASLMWQSGEAPPILKATYPPDEDGGAKQDGAEAVKRHQLAAEQGDAEAQNNSEAFGSAGDPLLLSKEEALRRAQERWGPAGAAGVDGLGSRCVGVQDPHDGFVIRGSGSTWDEAFEAADVRERDVRPPT
jgi:hypothetical protein